MALAAMPITASLFDGRGFLPHATCFLLKPDLIWLHVASDAVIALSYFMIPAVLVWFIRKRQTPLSFAWALSLFALFIVMCGISHVLDIVTIWKPIYYLQGYEKALTAAVSLLTAISIIPLVPKLLAMRSPEELAEANQRLREEIGARQLAEEDLRRSLDDTRRAVLELEQFAYITSHDLQGPLRTVSGFSQLLMHRHRQKLEGDALEFLDYIDRGSRQMQALIRDLLELSRVGRTAANTFERQPLADTVTKAVRSLQDVVERSGAEIVFGALPEVSANHGLLLQLFQNLIGNAIKFQKPGCTPRITISIERQGEEWNLIVADNGIGIPQDQLENIFAIFRRLHGAEEYEGTGIGLAICRKIAHFHGGEISARSDSSGTQFHIRLPVSPSVQRRTLATDGEPSRHLAAA